MRAALAGLRSPHPLALALPALYHEDDFAQRFLSGFDEVLSAVFCTLDNIDVYVDPSLAPADFVAWLAGWMGIALDENWPLERQRALVAQAGELYRWRGTAKGLTALVALYAGSEPEIEESGGVAWSPVPGAAIPGRAEPQLTVRLRVPSSGQVNHARLDALVAAAKPAHVPHRVEIVEEPAG